MTTILYFRTLHFHFCLYHINEIYVYGILLYIVVAWYSAGNTGGSVFGFPVSSAGEESACNAGDPSLIPRSGRSLGGGIGYPLRYAWASLVA